MPYVFSVTGLPGDAVKRVVWKWVKRAIVLDYLMLLGGMVWLTS